MVFGKVGCLRPYVFCVSCLSNFLFITLYTEDRNEIQLTHTVISTAQYKSELIVCLGAAHRLYCHLPWQRVNPGHHIVALLSRHQQNREGQGRDGDLAVCGPVTEHSYIHCYVMGNLSLVMSHDSLSENPSSGQRWAISIAHSSLGELSCSTFKVTVPLSDPYFSFLEKRIGLKNVALKKKCGLTTSMKYTCVHIYLHRILYQAQMGKTIFLLFFFFKILTSLVKWRCFLSCKKKKSFSWEWKRIY